MSTRKEEKSYIVNFINKYKEHMEYGELQNLLTYYSYNVLTRFMMKDIPMENMQSLSQIQAVCIRF